jgi:hypothetical protein
MNLLKLFRSLTTTEPHVVALAAAGVTFPEQTSIAERLALECDDLTTGLPVVRDPLLREMLTRRAVSACQGATSWIWRFQDGSVLTANDAGVRVRVSRFLDRQIEAMLEAADEFDARARAMIEGRP